METYVGVLVEVAVFDVLEPLGFPCNILFAAFVAEARLVVARRPPLATFVAISVRSADKLVLALMA
jgi:hypothetical protein